jgi:predicted phage-related endonuclease
VTLVVVADQSDRDAWLKARSAMITASEISSVLGFGHETMPALIRRKAKERVYGPTEGKEVPQMVAGRHMEAGVARWFAEERGLSIRLSRQLLARTDTPWLGATPDMIVGDGVPGEVKFCDWTTLSNWRSGSRRVNGWPFGFDIPTPTRIHVSSPMSNLKVAQADVGSVRGNVRLQTIELTGALKAAGWYAAPTKYLLQLLVQMYVMDAASGWLVASLGGATRVDMCFERDIPLENYWLDRAFSAWQEIQFDSGS